MVTTSASFKVRWVTTTPPLLADPVAYPVGSLSISTVPSKPSLARARAPSPGMTAATAASAETASTSSTSTSGGVHASPSR